MGEQKKWYVIQTKPKNEKKVYEQILKKEIEVFLDSELVANQLNREYKVKDSDLAPLFIKIWNLSLGFKNDRTKSVTGIPNK